MNPSPEQIQNIFDEIHSIAVIGARMDGPAYEVPEYLNAHGYHCYPVGPKEGEIWGETFVKVVTDLEQPIDAVVLFRRSEAIKDHVDEILAMDPLPFVVWLQKGIRDDASATRFEDAGIQVVQDRCMMVEHRNLS